MEAWIIPLEKRYYATCYRKGKWSPKLWGTLETVALRDGGVADPLETRYYATCVITPNLVAVGQTISASVEGVPKRLRMLGHRPLWTGA